MWYNKGTKKGRYKEMKEMFKVVRVCEITGRVEVVAKNLDLENAMARVKEMAKADTYATYFRVKQ